MKWTIFKSWRRMLVGAGIGLGFQSFALLATTIVTFQVEFDMYAVSLLAYTLLILAMAVGAALGLATRERP